MLLSVQKPSITKGEAHHEFRNFAQPGLADPARRGRPHGRRLYRPRHRGRVGLGGDHQTDRRQDQRGRVQRRPRPRRLDRALQHRRRTRRRSRPLGRDPVRQRQQPPVRHPQWHHPRRRRMGRFRSRKRFRPRQQRLRAPVPRWHRKPGVGFAGRQLQLDLARHDHLRRQPGRFGQFRNHRSGHVRSQKRLRLPGDRQHQRRQAQ